MNVEETLQQGNEVSSQDVPPVLLPLSVCVYAVSSLDLPALLSVQDHF